ncbi:HEAT repeat domain-containing protein [bacterium]|nr:HEAT repeat domain-containing protein [bacterium]
MIVYHGTTIRNAQNIYKVGFLPKEPSRKVWFAVDKNYARRVAKTRARSRLDLPVVLTCELDISQARERLGTDRVSYKNGVIAIKGEVPAASVIRSSSPLGDLAVLPDPEQIAKWLNELLELHRYNSVKPENPGIHRLCRWMENCLTLSPYGKIRIEEILHKAELWLPKFSKKINVVLKKLRAHRQVWNVLGTNKREEEALDCLNAQNPKRRIRGLELLAEIDSLHLFDWCVMFLDDESIDVRVAALRAMLYCDEVDTEIILPLAESEDKRIRAAAIAVLVKHSDENAPRWFEQALKDESACVRLETAALLSELDTIEHRYIFELALRDPNPRVKHIARKLTVGKGFKAA